VKQPTSPEMAIAHDDWSVWKVLALMLRHPVSLLFLRWNWKSASLSALFRAPIFFAASLRHGVGLALTGAAVETAFNAGGAGFYGAFLQNIRKAKPPWLAWLVGAWLVPALIQISENAFHFMAGTSRLHRSVIISICLSAASAMFNFFAMRRGSLLSGPGSESLQRDLGNMPRLILDFILVVPRWVADFFCGGRTGETENVNYWGESEA
jgi:hypothetical protein